MGKSSKVIQSSSCVTKQTYVFSCVFSFSSVWCVLSFYLKAPAATPMFWRSMSLGQTLAQCSAVQRRHYRGHSRPAGGVAFPAARSLYCSQVATTFAFFFFLFFLCRKHVFLCLLWVMWVNFSIFLSSPQVAFLRFLHLLSSFDWRNNPLIVNLNNQLTGKCSLTHIPFPCVWHKQIPLDLFLFTRPTYFYIRPYALLFQRQIFFASLSCVAVDYPEIKNGFMATRESLPVMFIATPKDKKLSMWTKRSPSIQVSGHTSTQITKYLIDQLSALNFKWLNITFV